ncbi:hypothetical protein [Paenibacillus radicis (ex Xue et al. 2023)]|uniref:Uncharacterized protein n=1 Tax=Paenibacillus radicis (ex Xue et al. 2023) TaxID=2972489 RepID=A0ABT1YN77_9BACL|nr:hypothetical protein [Paenibacillus radicis (ex Xue et al. 2023)]MCR8634630.1 hypothetical protein [Paenibacillus radicis (ex Xue et al. 2023)]
MTRNHVKAYRYRVGKNQFLVINIYQSATASAVQGNVIASNAVNVQISKKKQKRR